MKAIGLVFRAAAFLFNLGLAVAMFLLALVVLSSGRHNLDLAAIPLDGKTLTVALLLASIYAFVAMVLALRKGALVRLPMLLWNLAVVVLLAVAPTRPGFSFHGPDHFKLGLYLSAAALVALLGAWLQFRRARRVGS